MISSNLTWPREPPTQDLCHHATSEFHPVIELQTFTDYHNRLQHTTLHGLGSTTDSTLD